MSVQNPERIVTKQDLKDFYDDIFPYLGGSAAAGFTPVGTIIAVMGNHAPANYLICDGTVYNIADYPELANYFYNEFGSKNKFGGNGTTTFAVPNLLGEFLRMTGTNSHTNQGNGSAVGTHQDATQHLRFFASDAKTLAYYGESANNNLKNADTSVGSVTTGHKITSTDYTSSNAIIAYTSKPTNTSVLFCIATKNIYLNPSNDYSTDEKVVGTWIDGKPIYQKSFADTLTKTHETNLRFSYAYYDSLPNVDTVIGIDGVCSCRYSTNALVTQTGYLFNVDQTPNVTTRFSYNHETEMFSAQLYTAVEHNSLSFVATIRYTKTTD